MTGGQDAGTAARAAGGRAPEQGGVPWVALVVVLAAIYFAAATLGLSLAPLHRSVSLVWPPTGIALAALLLRGRGLWPGVALGAFLVNASSGVGLPAAAGIAAGNTLEALTAVHLLRRLAPVPTSLERPPEVLRFVVVAAGLATGVGASLGVTSLCVGGAAPWALYGTLWWQWWLGDAMGALVVTPVILTWTANPRITSTPARLLEGATLVALLTGVAELVFGGWVAARGIDAPLAFAVFPFTIWAALRFGQREAAATTLIISVVATWNTANAVGPFAAGSATESFLLLQLFMSVVAVTALVLGAAIGGRRRVEEALRQSEGRYRELFENATALVYTAELDGRFTALNRRGEEITGYSREEARGLTLADLAAPADRPLVREMIARQAGQAEPVVYELEIVARDGRAVALELSTRLIPGAGRSVGVQGVARDVTSRKQAEAALARANRQLTEWVGELEARGREAARVSEMSDLLQSCLAVDEAYRVVGTFMPRLFPTQSGALGVLGASRHLVEVVAAWGAAPPAERLFPLDQCWALRRGKAYGLAAGEGGLVCAHAGAVGPAGYVCLPMMAHGEPLGVLHLRGVPFGPSPAGPLGAADQHLPVTVAERIALALANLRLRETLRTQSILDPLTGLFNRRHMEEMLDLEVARATRGQRAMGLIMLDLDHFKPLNDAYGHDAGDALLRELARVLKTRVREGDIACRYGGEEFVLILPEAALEQTRRRAEELIAELKQLRLPHRDRLVGPVTASAGVAVFPEHGKTAAALMQAADAALYRAKAAGRDRVCAAE